MTQSEESSDTRMRESRWRSMSIMDLNLTRRKSGGNLVMSRASVATPISTNTQNSYELIKSTQVRKGTSIAVLCAP